MQRHFAHIISKLAKKAAALACAVLALASCSHVFDDEGDCEVTYRLRFIYDYNIKWADAFAHEVKSVHLFAFDNSGRLVWEMTDSSAALASGDYSVEMPLTPGTYRLVAWCGADNIPGDEHFTIASGSSKITSEAQLTATMLRQHLADGSAVSDVNLHPLYYGAMDLTLEDYSTEGGEYIYTLPLMKDTNKIKIVLQHLSGVDLDVNDYDFKIIDDNGALGADNGLLADEQITYRPWATYSGSAGVETSTDSRTITQVKVAQAELTVCRLMADHRQQMMLIVTRKSDGQTIIRIPVIDYALLVKSFETNNISDQEYLDRQDEYSMVFFLDQTGHWLNTQIMINSWRVVLQSHDLN